MKNEKLTIISGIALACMMLFAACDNVFNHVETQTPPIENGAEAGYGRINIIVGEGEAAARTLFPSTEFDKYVYTFTKIEIEEDDIILEGIEPDGDGFFTLEVGDYTVTVDAYVGDEEPYTLVASGSSALFTVGTGDNDPVRVSLDMVILVGEGEFSYTITYPVGAEIEIALQNWQNPVVTVELDPGPLGGKNGIAETLPLETGSYLLTVTVKKDGRFSGINEAIHVYPLRTTTYAREFVDADFYYAVTTLAADTWADGEIAALGSGAREQWFTFTATADTQFIYFEPGTLSDAYVQVYNSTGSAEGSQTEFRYSTRNTSRTLTDGNEYYIRVTPYSSSYSGAYKIGFGSTIIPPETNIIPLTAGTWTDGDIVQNGQQWFKFTATANTQFIHFEPDTLTNVYVQVYNSTGSAEGSQAGLSNSARNTSRTLTDGNEYYIRVMPYSSSSSGAYKIGFTTSLIPPETNITTLTADIWAGGTLISGGQQWFKFIATADTQFIHLAGAQVVVQLYNSTATAIVGEQMSSTASRTLTTDNEYYIRVTPYVAGGSYRIGFGSRIPPETNVIALTANTWADGSVVSEQWFTFTATADTQYIHYEMGSLHVPYIQLYDNTVITTVGERTQLGQSGSSSSITRTVTTGKKYYIRITPAVSGGRYRIGFTTSSAQPSIITLPTENVTTLTANTWAEGKLTASYSEQWFAFTATATTQYIHLDRGGVNVQVHDSTGAAVGEQTYVNSVKYISRSVTINNKYYIRVRGMSTDVSASTYRIGFNASATPWSGTPDAPQNFTATPGNGQVVLSWTAPASSGDGPITGYQVSNNGGATWVAASSDTGHTFTGLTGGIYTFCVRAVNAVGNGAETISAITFYTVTFNTNDATGTVPTAQTVSAGSSVTLPVGSGLTKNGYTFGGWNTNAAGTGSNYAAGTSYTPTASITLYAKWEFNPYVPGSTLADKLSWLQSNAASGNDYILEINANESIAPRTLSYSGKSNISITLRGVGSERTVSLSSNGFMFEIGSGVTLILDNNVTLSGRTGNNSALIKVADGSNLTMNEGAKISGNTAPGSSRGGGVYVASNGSFTMRGGEISGNTAESGGGVFLDSSGTFTVYSGKISGNGANYYGGGVNGGTFTMNGGEISGNTAGIGGGGVVTGTFIMNGGEISGNTAGVDCGGGGVLILWTTGFGQKPSFTKSGGTIYGYTAGNSKSNVVKNNSGVVVNNMGHAVCCVEYILSVSVLLRKETTAGPTVNMSLSFLNDGNSMWASPGEPWDYYNEWWL